MFEGGCDATMSHWHVALRRRATTPRRRPRRRRRSTRRARRGSAPTRRRRRSWWRGGTRSCRPPGRRRSTGRKGAGTAGSCVGPKMRRSCASAAGAGWCAQIFSAATVVALSCTLHVACEPILCCDTVPTHALPCDSSFSLRRSTAGRRAYGRRGARGTRRSARGCRREQARSRRRSTARRAFTHGIEARFDEDVSGGEAQAGPPREHRAATDEERATWCASSSPTRRSRRQ